MPASNAAGAAQPSAADAGLTLELPAAGRPFRASIRDRGVPSGWRGGRLLARGLLSNLTLGL